ncbi:DUF3800 domain-containing protein [Lapidilactobacillus luobeiensis]|uniref:DUF3800 domain-containing protein n=1 Tax=Lapidilactobacillus luobeiensis TaxID=2950371 RepID=UPI0021C26EC7|nr:DUF3800 domain-containing protein [Lapidilactobacillus luobeiensis]
MTTETLTVYIDESGNLGQDQGRYFTLAAVVGTTEAMKGLRRRQKNAAERFRRSSPTKKWPNNEVKAAALNQKERATMLRQVLTPEIAIYALILDKRHLPVTDFASKNSSYDYWVQLLLDQIVATQPEITELLAQLDQRALKDGSQNSLADHLRIHFNFEMQRPDLTVSINYYESQLNYGIQAADFAANAINNFYETQKKGAYAALHKNLRKTLTLPQTAFGKKPTKTRARSRQKAKVKAIKATNPTSGSVRKKEKANNDQAQVTKKVLPKSKVTTAGTIDQVSATRSARSQTKKRRQETRKQQRQTTTKSEKKRLLEVSTTATKVPEIGALPTSKQRQRKLRQRRKRHGQANKSISTVPVTQSKKEIMRNQAVKKNDQTNLAVNQNKGTTVAKQLPNGASRSNKKTQGITQGDAKVSKATTTKSTAKKVTTPQVETKANVASSKKHTSTPRRTSTRSGQKPAAQPSSKQQRPGSSEKKNAPVVEKSTRSTTKAPEADQAQHSKKITTTTAGQKPSRRNQGTAQKSVAQTTRETRPTTTKLKQRRWTIRPITPAVSTQEQLIHVKLQEQRLTAAGANQTKQRQSKRRSKSVNGSKSRSIQHTPVTHSQMLEPRAEMTMEKSLQQQAQVQNKNNKSTRSEMAVKPTRGVQPRSVDNQNTKKNQKSAAKPNAATTQGPRAKQSAQDRPVNTQEQQTDRAAKVIPTTTTRTVPVKKSGKMSKSSSTKPHDVKRPMPQVKTADVAARPSKQKLAEKKSLPKRQSEKTKSAAQGMPVKSADQRTTRSTGGTSQPKALHEGGHTSQHVPNKSRTTTRPQKNSKKPGRRAPLAKKSNQNHNAKHSTASTMSDTSQVGAVSTGDGAHRHPWTIRKLD